MISETRECKKHGSTEFRWYRDGKGSRWRCRLCGVEAVTRRRQKVRQQLIDQLGGQCQRCNYNKCPAALYFHHVNPATKKFTISSNQWLSFDKCQDEIKKCILLCANCHAEVENGFNN